MAMRFLVLDRGGRVVSNESTPEGAREVARDYAAGGQIIDETGGATSAQVRENPVPYIHRTLGPGRQPVYQREMLEPDPEVILGREDALPSMFDVNVGVRGPLALKKMGLQQVTLEEVADLTQGFTDMGECWERLRPYLQGIAAGLDYAHFIDHTNLLKSNYKMAKGSKGYKDAVKKGFFPRQGNVVGLSLLPYWSGPALANQVLRDHPGTPPPMWFGEKAPKVIPDPREMPAYHKHIMSTIEMRRRYRQDVQLREKYRRAMAEGLVPAIEPEEMPGREPVGVGKRVPGVPPEGIQTGMILLRRCIGQLGAPRGTPSIFRNFNYHKSLIDKQRNAWVPEVFEDREWPRTASLCPGSTIACRSACLVLSGQQLSGYGPKLAFTMAIYDEPVAFYSWLIHCCLDFFETNKNEPTFVRLNVFSDVPHELVCPALFEMCQADPSNIRSRVPLKRRGPRHAGECEFYDYTAISPLGRVLPENYDLTMSFKGNNWPEVQDALDAGYRASMVLVPMEVGVGESHKSRLGAGQLPKYIAHGGKRYSVVDGDADDMRPLDPGGVICALRYKTPKLLPEEYIGYQRYRSGFVVPVYEFHDDDGEVHYVAVSTPRHSEAEEYEMLSPKEKRAQAEAERRARAYMAEHPEEYGRRGAEDVLDVLGVEEGEEPGMGMEAIGDEEGGD